MGMMDAETMTKCMHHIIGCWQIIWTAVEASVLRDLACQATQEFGQLDSARSKPARTEKSARVKGDT
jgi:hypothetical protein